MMEKLQINAMKNFTTNKEYFQVYMRICTACTVGTVGTVGTSHEPTSAALAHIRRSLYEHDVISALVHVYLGRFSDDAALSELPEWSAITNKGTYTRVANKDPILRVLVWLVHHHQEEQGEHQGEPMSARAVAACKNRRWSS